MDDKQRSEFVDLIGFWIAIACYAEAISDEEYRKDVVLQGAMQSLYRFQDLVAQGIDNILIPACQDSPYLQRFVSRLDRASRKGKSLELAIVQGRVLREFMSVLRGHTDKIRDIFPGPRESQAAVKIAAAAAADDGVQTLRMLATIPPASSIRVIRRWILEALNRLGAAPSEVEVVLAESSEASSLGSELRQIESVLDKMDPTSADAANLTQKREDVITRIQSVVAASNSPEVVMSTAVSAASGSKEYATKIGAELRLNPDKERCVMLRGKGIIAAGAGSGKTLTLAAKVLYHMKELGVPPSGIIATSFSRKSAAELIHRINKYGGDIDPRNTTGFGTTHSIAAKLMREYGYPTREELAAYESTDLITMAIKQVQLGPFNIPAPEPQSIFFRPAPPPVAPPTTRISPSLGFKGALESAFASRHRLNSFARSFIEGFFNPRDPYYTSTMRKTRNLTDHSGLTDKQKAVLQRIFDQAGVGYSLYASKTASDDKADRYRFWSTPANQWFNLGLTLEDEKGQPLPRGNFSRAITKYKGRAISPTEAFAEASGDPELEGHAAVYAAYEFLKGPEGEPTLAGKGDFDDLLLDMSKMMLSSPDILRKIRSRFKTVLVDEAQDLNRTQHLMFGLISGYVNPDNVPKIATARSMGELAYPNGEMTADTYTLIGDDKQCVDANSLIRTPEGVKLASDIKGGDIVLSYRNGKIVPQEVRLSVPSSWEHGVRIRTRSGRELLMSPNHRLWATEPKAQSDQMIVYLMYRHDMGFRVGVTNKAKIESGDKASNSYGGKAFMEQAERLWVLDICESRDSALLAELQYSLRFGVPTTVFMGTHRGMDHDRIQQVFHEFGQNGFELLESKGYDFEYPHWMSQSYTKHGRSRHVLTLIAHSNNHNQVMMEWQGGHFDEVLAGYGVKHACEDRRRLRRYFKNYREALEFALDVRDRTSVMMSHKLSVCGRTLREINASGLFAGMSVPVMGEDGIFMDLIESVDRAPGKFIDLDVDDASNFFANDILTHNSIYAFRGADPEAFIDMSDLVEGGAGFKTEILKTNYRSGEAIVSAANHLISHNLKQIPMACNANPDRVDKGGVNIIPFSPAVAGDFSEPADWFARQIEDTMAVSDQGEAGYNNFGIGLRTGAEAYFYGMALLMRGIPFRSNLNFFTDKNAKALLAWLTIVDEGLEGNTERINAAVLEARIAPGSMLGPTFVERLTQRASGNYIKWLSGNAASIYGPGSKYTAYVNTFTDNLLLATSWKGLGAEEALVKVLGLEGVGGQSITSTMIESVRNNEEIMAELRAESEGGDVSNEDIAARALAPIRPLNVILKSRSDLTECMTFIRQLQSANDKLAAKDDPDAKGFNQPAVTLGTMHSWKGLEVPVMFVPFVGGKFPRASSDRELEDERRLAYVAITRGQNQVYVMDIPQVIGPKRSSSIVHSQFVHEICAPTTPPEGALRLASSDFVDIPSGWSPMEEDAMDAFLRGEDPMLMTSYSGWGDVMYGEVE